MRWLLIQKRLPTSSPKKRNPLPRSVFIPVNLELDYQVTIRWDFRYTN